MACLARRATAGALGGVVAAGCMSAARTAAKRAHLVDRGVPQVVEAWLARRVRIPGGQPGHQSAALALHLGYGAAWGALLGVLDRGRRPALTGPLFGAAQWAFGFFALFPALGISRPAWRHAPVELAVNLGAHLLYGLVAAETAAELAVEAQGPAPKALREAVRFG